MEGAKSGSNLRIFTDKLYAFNDGRCAARAKKAIEDFISNKHDYAKPLLYHIFKTYCSAGDYSSPIISISAIKAMPLLKRILFLLKTFIN